LGDKKEEAVRGEIESHAAQSPKKVVFGNPMYGLPGRLWEKIV
jgi:hypothetical protein